MSTRETAGKLFEKQLGSKDLKNDKNFIDMPFIKKYFGEHLKTVIQKDPTFVTDFCNENEEFLRNFFCGMFYNSVFFGMLLQYGYDDICFRNNHFSSETYDILYFV